MYVVKRLVREYFSHLETSTSLMCHTCYDTIPLFTRCHPKDAPFRKVEVFYCPYQTQPKSDKCSTRRRELLTSTVTTISYSLQDVTLPEKVDVVVSEWMVGVYCHFYRTKVQYLLCTFC